MPPRKRTAIRDRKERQAEKQRLEEMKAKMSAKKLQRLKKVRLASLGACMRLMCSAWAGPRRSTSDLSCSLWSTAAFLSSQFHCDSSMLYNMHFYPDFFSHLR